jgi:hypothetical protein
MTEQELMQEATNIRDENREGWNSAFRIGSFLLNQINYLKQKIDLEAAHEEITAAKNAAIEEIDAYSDSWTQGW